MIDGVCGVEVVPARAPLAGDSTPAAGIDLRLNMYDGKRLGSDCLFASLSAAETPL